MKGFMVNLIDSGHAHLNDGMYKMQLSESPDCECDTATQTIEHIIMNCPHTKHQRETMNNQVDYIYAMHCTPVSERKLDFNTLLWQSHSSLLTTRAVTDVLIVYLNNTSFTI